jgi:pimeloyl-ACP methyl ester carboxylesterase
MNAVFVHGMGRTSCSWMPTLIRFRARGVTPVVFGYSVALHDFSSIVWRLSTFLAKVSQRGEYVAIGHSLGGVLLRAALYHLPGGTALPEQLFLLGSPVMPSRLAKSLAGNPLFRAATQDCGRLLGSDERMSSVPRAHIPTVAILGTRGWHGRGSPFGTEPNDGIVSVREASAEWFAEEIRVAVVHTLLPSSRQVAGIMLERIIRNGT